MYVLSKQFLSFYARVPRQQDHKKKSYRLATLEKPPWYGVRESRPCAACFGNKTAGRERRCFCRGHAGPAAHPGARARFTPGVSYTVQAETGFSLLSQIVTYHEYEPIM